MKSLDKIKILRALLAVDIALLIFYLLTQAWIGALPWRIVHWFDFDSESNFPAWFSSAQLLALAVLAYIHASVTEGRVLRRFYFLVSFIFLFFSVDEACLIHESMTVVLKKMSIYSPLPRAHGTWMLVYPAIFIILALLFRRGLVLFLKEKAGRTVFILGALVFVTGGVVFELIGYYMDANGTSAGLPGLIEVSLEESFELAGQSFMIFGVMTKIDSVRPLFGGASTSEASPQGFDENFLERSP